MNNKIFAVFFAFALLFSALVFGVITLVSPTPANFTNQTRAYVDFNVTSTQLINISGTSMTVLEWANETATRLNLTPTQVVNSTTAGAGPANYSFWNVSGLLQGVHRFKAYVWENTTTPIVVGPTINVTVDSTAPTATVTSPTNGINITTSTQTITFNVTDNVVLQDLAYKVFVDNVNRTEPGITNTTNSSLIQINLTGLTNGTRLINIEVRDAVNNIRNVSLNITVDSVAPTITFVTQNGTNTTNNTPQLSFNITDNVITADLAFKVFVVETNHTEPGISNLTNATLRTINLSALGNGTHTVKIEARDAAGNIANSTPLTVRVDTVAPTITFNTPVLSLIHI